MAALSRANRGEDVACTWLVLLGIALRAGDRRILGMLLSRAAAGRCFQGRPVDKFSVVLAALFAVIFLSERPSLNPSYAGSLQQICQYLY